MRKTVAAIAILAAACTTSPSLGGGAFPAAAVDPPERVVMPRPAPQGVRASLQPTASCDDLLARYIELALAEVGPWGLGGGWAAVADMETVAAGAAEAPGTSRVSGTNNQVAGVDEADQVKTDGTYLYAISGTRIEIARMARDGVDLVATLELDWVPQSLLLDGDHLLAIGGDQHFFPVEPVMGDIAPVAPAGGATNVVHIDVSDPSAPAVTDRLTVDGSLVDARMVDGRVQFAISNGPLGFSWSTPSGAGIRAESAALASNRRLIEESTLDNWLPWFRHEDENGHILTEGRFVDCADVLVPKEPSGLSTLTLATFDSDLTTVESAGVVASATTYYATNRHTYLATNDWSAWSRDGDGTTSIHLFETDPGPAYLASGTVDGTVIGQFALDEHEGVLRVASTTGQWGEMSESMVTTLRPDGRELVEVGQVDGLGKGERIYSVRFIGDLGYVVTFRQTDPLYTLDLSDPADPRATGELKITGYSAYLHPVGEGRLLGIGQEADERGVVSGLQMSLFDITDPSAPTRLDQIHLPEAWSAAEGEHHAFTFFDGMALVPFTVWNDSKGKSDAGTLLVEVGTDALAEPVTLRTNPDAGLDPWALTPNRTLVTPELILGITHSGISVHSRASHELVDFVDFSSLR